MGFPGASDSKVSVCNTGNPGLIPGSRRYPREGNGYPLQYSCVVHSIDRGTWWAIVHFFFSYTDVGGRKMFSLPQKRLFPNPWIL